MVGSGREITIVKVTILSCLAYSHVPLFLHSKKHLFGQKFHGDEEVKHKVTTWLCRQAVEFYDIVMKTCTQAKQMP